MNEEIKKFANDLWKKEFDKFIVNDIVDRYIKTLQHQLDQYKNNWEELKKWLKEEIERLMKIEQTNNVIFLIGAYDEVLNKMKELEEDK